MIINKYLDIFLTIRKFCRRTLQNHLRAARTIHCSRHAQHATYYFASPGNYSRNLKPRYISTVLLPGAEKMIGHREPRCIKSTFCITGFTPRLVCLIAQTNSAPRLWTHRKSPCSSCRSSLPNLIRTLRFH